MRKAIYKKLHSQRGASILLALLALLVLLTIGALVITAASAAAGHTSRNQEEQQNYLAVSSAARLLEEHFTQAEFVGVYDEITTTTINIKTGATLHSTTRYERNSETGVKNSTLLKAAEEDLTELFYASTGYADLGGQVPSDMSYKAILETDSEHPMPNVEGKLVISHADGVNNQPQYSIAVLLQIPVDTGLNVNTITLKLASLAPSTTSQSHEPIVSNDEETQTTTTRTTHTTTITWTNPVITKGATL